MQMLEHPETQRQATELGRALLRLLSRLGPDRIDALRQELVRAAEASGGSDTALHTLISELRRLSLPAAADCSTAACIRAARYERAIAGWDLLRKLAPEDEVHVCRAGRLEIYYFDVAGELRLATDPDPVEALRQAHHGRSAPE